MTDIVERLRAVDHMSVEDCFLQSSLFATAADKIERLQAGLMRAMQYENKCDQTGKPCREPSKCGCYLEAESWCEDFIVGGPGRT